MIRERFFPTGGGNKSSLLSNGPQLDGAKLVAKPLRESNVIEWIRSRHMLYETSPAAYFEMLTAQQGAEAARGAALHS